MEIPTCTPKQHHNVVCVKPRAGNAWRYVCACMYVYSYVCTCMCMFICVCDSGQSTLAWK